MHDGPSDSRSTAGCPRRFCGEQWFRRRETGSHRHRSGRGELPCFSVAMAWRRASHLDGPPLRKWPRGSRLRWAALESRPHLQRTGARPSRLRGAGAGRHREHRRDRLGGRLCPSRRRPGRPSSRPSAIATSAPRRAFKAVHAIVPPDVSLWRSTGVQIQPINTIYQLYADKTRWRRRMPRRGSICPSTFCTGSARRAIAEYTNATHTGLIGVETRQWSDEIFEALGLDLAAAPETGRHQERLWGQCADDLRRLPAFATTQLIAPACHDTASAIAGIPERPGDWAYISSGTWSLVGVPLAHSLRSHESYSRGFTNLGAVGGGILFHRGIPGMWLLRQCMNTWDSGSTMEHRATHRRGAAPARARSPAGPRRPCSAPTRRHARAHQRSAQTARHRPAVRRIRSGPALRQPHFSQPARIAMAFCCAKSRR